MRMQRQFKGVLSETAQFDCPWSTVATPEGSSTGCIREAVVPTPSVCSVWQALFLDSLQGHSEVQYISALWDAGTMMDSSVTIKSKGVITIPAQDSSGCRSLPCIWVYLHCYLWLNACVLSSLFVCLYVYISIHCNISFLFSIYVQSCILKTTRSSFSAGNYLYVLELVVMLRLPKLHSL